MRKTLFCLLLLCTAAVAAAAEPPETVLSRIYPKNGKEAQLEAVLRENIAIMKKLDVIEPSPVILVRERDHFVMLFTWRSASIPDNAPPEIRKNWADMNALARIEFEAVTPLVMK
jgi:hypothetical protein